MSILPSLNAREIIRALKKAGFEEDRKKGSHLVMFNESTNTRTIVPVHPGNVKKYLVHAIIRDTGLSTAEFVDLL